MEEIVISHASDIVISTNTSSSSSRLQIKEQPVRTTKIPVRKSTLSSGEVILHCPKISQFLILNFNQISSLLIPSCCRV